MINATANHQLPTIKNTVKNQKRNSNISFKADTFQVDTAIENGSKTCPHAMARVKQALKMIKEVQQDTDTKVSIPLVGQNIVEKVDKQVADLPEKAKQAAHKVAEFVSKPYKACSQTCSKNGLTMGEVISNVFIIWGVNGTDKLGNPFTLETSNQKKLSNEELSNAIKKADDPYAFIREVLGKHLPFNTKEKKEIIVNSIAELGLTKGDLRSRQAQMILQPKSESHC